MQGMKVAGKPARNISALLAESDFQGTYRQWELWRRPICDFIAPYQTVLDVGWPTPRVDVVVAPWIEHRPFLLNCLLYSYNRVVFTAYDDQIARGSAPAKGCERERLVVVDSYSVSGTLEIVAVDSSRSLEAGLMSLACCRLSEAG